MPLSHKQILLGLILITSLLLMPVSLGFVLNEALIPSRGIIDYGINTRVARYVNGTYYVQISHDNGTSETVYKSVDADDVINYAISISVGGTVFVANTGSDYEIDSAIRMKSGVTLLLDNNILIRQTSGSGIISFSGDASHSIAYAHVNSLGRATLYGSGLRGNGGVYMTYAYNCSVRNVEIANIGYSLVKLTLSDYNVLENVYAHRYSMAMTGSHGIELDSSGHNKLLNCTVDAEHYSTSRSCVFIGCNYAKDGMYNEIIGGAYMNSAQDNGIYLCSAGQARVDYATIKNVRVSGNNDSGHSGLKLRPASYCNITGLISENNHFGVTLGTHMNPYITAGTDSDYNYIQGIIRNNDRVGISLEIDYDGYSVSHNRFDIVSQGNGHHGVMMTTYGHPNVEISYNELNVDASNNDVSGIWMEELGGAYVRRNNITGVFEGNTEYGIRTRGSGCTDNRFNAIIRNNGIDVDDRGTRTRINGVGREAAGVGNPPTVSLWDINDIVKNTDDNTSWIKDATGTMKPLTQLTARFATFIKRASSLSSTTVQFIDQSYDPSGTIVAWNWTFGDMSTSSDQHPMHTYPSIGDYTVSLTVTNNSDFTDTVTMVISIRPEAHA